MSEDDSSKGRELVRPRSEGGLVAQSSAKDDTSEAFALHARREAVPQTVLSEEEYTSTLSLLIRRDFFPDVEIREEEYTLPEAIRLRDGSLRNLSLASFHARYTSEDNASFQELMQKDSQRRRDAFRWAYEAEERSKLQARNAFFYGPTAFIEGRNTLPNTSISTSSGINHANTRLRSATDDPEADMASQSGSETPRSSRIDAAIDGLLRGASSESGSDVDRQHDAEGGYAYVSPVPSHKPDDLAESQKRQLMTWGSLSGTPRPLNRQLVGPSLPTAESMQGDQQPPNFYDGAFRIPPTPRRDVLARQLAERPARTSTSSTSKQRQRDTSIFSATPSSSSRSFSSKRTRSDLTPAAQNLLDRTSRTSSGQTSHTERGQTTDRREKHSEMRLRSQRWTPSPVPRRRQE